MSVLTSPGSSFMNDLRRCKANDRDFRNLDWSDVRLDAADAKLLAAALENNTHLQKLSVRYGVYMSNSAAEQLERALTRTRVVRAVVSGRSYSHNGRRVVRDFQANANAGLRRLCVANAAWRAATNDRAMDAIDWSNMGLEDDDILRLAPSLSGNMALQRISLSNNRFLSDQAVTKLASALESSACLRVDIDGCHHISQPAATALRRVWVSNTCQRVKAEDSALAEIDWSNTEADDEDVCMLAAALCSTCKVNTLTLAHNRLISDAGARALQSVLQHCAVVVVALDVTSVGEPLKAAIRQLCVANAARRISANDPGLVELDWRVMRRESTLNVQYESINLP